MQSMNKALFLDRDGTINVDKHYLINPDDFVFEKNVAEVLKLAQQKGYLLIVLTNQSGIARGYFGEQELHKLHTHIQGEAAKNGFVFSDFFYCPHYKNGSVKEYAIECDCRKPKPGLINQALQKYNIDLSQSLMIGDKDADILLGKSVGVKTVLVGSGYGGKFKESEIGYDYFIDDFSGLIPLLK